MANILFSSTSSFDFSEIQGRYSDILEDYHKDEAGIEQNQKQNQMFSMDGLGEISPPLFSQLGAYQEENSAKKVPTLLEEQRHLLQQNKSLKQIK